MTGPVTDPIAVISLAGRFPGADDVTAFWENLRAGREGITRFSREELLARGRDPAQVNDPRFVGAEGVLSDIAGFDAAFFGYSPREAEIMDPQHRLCLEAAWAAFDSAGYDPATLVEPVGVFLAAGLSSYLVRNLLPNTGLTRLVGGFPLLIHNDKDFAATTVSHKLGLTGPSYAVGSACSSSLVAVHLACHSLQSFECDMALAGGVSLQVPQGQGYVYAEDGVYSPDGRCAAFDASAGGTVGGSGVGVVLLKRLSDAVRERDRVHALILGTAVNNDGANKVGYTAPGLDGQAAVIVEAHAVSGVGADTIGYVEAHGTGTSLGDPIEVAALTRAFRAGTERTGFCALGSVKTNIGHLDAAAGVTGLIKAVLAVRDGIIPASLNYRTPNPRIDFAATPFHVAGTTRPWQPGDLPRRAGVSSFGIGGTNAHVVLEQPPPPPPRAGRPRSVQPLVLSARTEEALADSARNLAGHLRREQDADLADVAATLAGRRPFPHRRVVVCRDVTAAIDALDRPGAAGPPASPDRAVVFLFPGQGAAYPGMAEGLAAGDATFRRHLDECAEPLAGLGVDLAEALRCPPGTATATRLGQPALFAVEYALARTLQDWGLAPAAMLGHSLGEYVAATLAGVFSLPDALRLVTVRGRLQAELPPGRMLVVPLPGERLRPLLSGGLSVAAVNAPDQCVVAGEPAAVTELARTLRGRGVSTRILATAHAFHSPAVEPVLARFRAVLSEIEFRPPVLRYASNLTGDWARPEEVCEPDYWLAHMRRPVRFGDGLARCLGLGPVATVEVGPSAGLTGLVRRHPPVDGAHHTVRCLPQPSAGQEPSEVGSVVAAVADLWAVGCPVRWDAFHRAREPRRVSVPAYPFQRRRHWVEPPAAPTGRPGFAELSAALRTALSQPEPDGTRGVDDHPGLRADLELLCVVLADRYLRSAGVPGRPGDRCPVPELRDRLGLLPAFSRFLDFLLAVAASGGVLRRLGDEVVFSDRVDPPAVPELVSRVVREHPGFAGLVELLVHCAEAYPSALSTPGAALGVLYPGGSGELLRRTLGERTVEHRAVTRMTVLLGDLLDRLAENGAVRVLEVGAGEGNLTRHLVTRAGGRLRYHATDISRLFSDRLAAEAARRGFDFVTTGVLDIGADPAAQGFAGREYDLVCALDVVHATQDVRAGLRNLRSLLAPGGLLALVETVGGDPWLSMIWGLSDGWWSHRDGLRGLGPLLDAPRWREAVAGCGFAATEVLTARTGPRDAVLILAQAPTVTASDVPAAVPADPGWPAKRPDIAEWGYRPGWRHAPPAVPDPAAVTGSCLVFSSGPLGHAVERRLAALGADVVRVDAEGPDSFDPERPEHYRSLIERLSARGRAPRLAVHLWALEDALARGRAATPESMPAAQRRGLHSLLHLARALGAQDGREQVRLVAVTGGCQDVLGDDLTHPEHATVLAAVKVVPREYPRIACAAVDVDPRQVDTHPDRLAAQVVDELLAARESTVAAYRGRRRFQPDHTPCPLRPEGAGAGPRPGGVYLVCGGLGGIGLSLAEDLGRLPAKVVLTRRRPFPAREDWPEYLAGHSPEDPTGVLIKRLQGIAAAGGEVLVLPADLTDPAALRAVVAEAERRFGPLTGVVHAAGVPDTEGVIQRRATEDTDAAMAAKVYGTAVLDEVLGDRELDLFVLCSSIGTVLHKLKFGEVGYVAGNEYLNAFAAYRGARRPGVTVAIAWTDWLESGMWAAAQERLAGRYDVGRGAGPEGNGTAVLPTDDLLGGLTPAEGAEVFRRVLRNNVAPQVVVSTQDLDALLARHAAYTTGDHLAVVSRLSAAGGRSRTGLSTRYTAPGTDLEHALATWYAELLGYDRVGRDDDFFELGGDSLLALRLLSMVRSGHGVEVSVAQLFDTPTVAGLAAFVGRPAGGADRREVVL